MDTSGFFQYPGAEQRLPDEEPRGFFDDRSEEDWTLLLEHTETRLYRPGQTVLHAGDADRALYLLSDGVLEAPSGQIQPIATLGEAAFLDGRPRAVTVTAVSEAEVLRLSYDAFLSLSARRPDLGRALLLDLGRILAARLHTAGDQIVGWTG
jgi:CRP/FNR family cyclic AMP-dependent transcriptional regulator